MGLHFGKIRRGFPAFGGSRRFFKNIRRKLGLTSKNKWLRQLKRRVKGYTGASSAVASSVPTSASTYQYQGRTLSQLMGGV